MHDTNLWINLDTGFGNTVTQVMEGRENGSLNQRSAAGLQPQSTYGDSDYLLNNVESKDIARLDANIACQHMNTLIYIFMQSI